MATLDMGNSIYNLDEKSVNNSIKPGSIGNYALGLDTPSSFNVKYVGRSDTDLNQRLLAWCVDKINGKVTYTHFKFSYSSSIKNAFEKECINYHDFGESKSLANEIHPDRPKNTDWKCPKCNIFGRD
ncbi:MAG: hypothetical protein WC821_04310 [archaeon]|jgi:hypothetical protein